MNVEQASRHDLEEYAIWLMSEFDRIRKEWNEDLPRLKHELVKVETELYRRDKQAMP